MKVSVLTLVRGRKTHLRHLMLGLANQLRAPDELVIAYMQRESYSSDLPELQCPVRECHLDDAGLPLAKARNQAARLASGEVLIFLDVDCIPSASLVARYLWALERQRGLYLGEVRYLPQDAVGEDRQYDENRLERLAVQHPARPALAPGELRREPEAGQLWGLSFALFRQDYLAVGGMDERYIGYGGEETDLAFRLAYAGLAFYWLGGARAYHQYHPQYAPPLHHFDDIIENARRFRATWGTWCMDYFLGLFVEAGFIAWVPECETIEILRRPQEEDIRRARLPPEVLFG